MVVVRSGKAGTKQFGFPRARKPQERNRRIQNPCTYLLTASPRAPRTSHGRYRTRRDEEGSDEQQYTYWTVVLRANADERVMPNPKTHKINATASRSIVAAIGACSASLPLGGSGSQ